MNQLVLASVGGFASGVLLYSFFNLGWTVPAFFVLVGSACLVFRCISKTSSYAVVAVFLLLAAVGSLRTALVPTSVPEAFVSLVGTEASLTGVVVADPDIRETSQRLIVETEKEEVRTRVLVVAPTFPEVRYGGTIQATGYVERPKPFETDGNRTFAYDRFLAKDGVFLTMSFADVEHVAPREGLLAYARGVLSDLKFSGIDALGAALPEPQASLASGLILGGKQGLGEALLDDFIRSGLVHIVVLSGYNVMIIADFIMRAFGFLAKGWAAGLGAFSIAAFVLMAGAGPASIRAGIMASIALYGRATGRTYEAFRALLFAGILMVVWSPLTLAYDPGFQLSFVATLGLIFGAPITERWFLFIKSTFLREIVASTVAAQIAVLPLLLYQNGLFSLVALPANILVLPLVPAAMLFSLFAMLSGWFFPFAAPAVGMPASLLLSYIIAVVEFSSELPFAATLLSAFPFFIVIGAYIALGYAVYRIGKAIPLARQRASQRRTS